MNAFRKYTLSVFISLFLLSCEDSKTQLSKSSPASNASKAIIETQAAEESAKRKTARLYEALTGTHLLDGNPLKIDLEKLVLDGKLRDAAQKITHRFNGSKAFYNNVVKNFAIPINRAHSINDPVTDLTALFVGATRDDLTIDELFFGNFYYFDPGPNNPSTGNPTQVAYPRILPDNSATQLGHYDYLDQRGSLRDELVKETKGSGDIGLFTTHAWAKAYYDAGTKRRPWKGIVEHFYCQEQSNIKTIYIPDDFVRRDVPREAGGATDSFQQNCKGCHAQMDPISTVFQLFDYNAGTGIIVKDDSFRDKIAAGSEKIFESGFAPTDDTWWIYSTDSQEKLLGFRNVVADSNGQGISFVQVGSGLKMATGKGLKDLARTIAFSKGVAHCLAERIVLQLVHGKVWSLATVNELDRAKLDGDRDLINEVAEELLTSRKIRRAFESVAIKYAERE